MPHAWRAGRSGRLAMGPPSNIMNRDSVIVWSHTEEAESFGFKNQSEPCRVLTCDLKVSESCTDRQTDRQQQQKKKKCVRDSTLWQQQVLQFERGTGTLGRADSGTFLCVELL